MSSVKDERNNIRSPGVEREPTEHPIPPMERTKISFELTSPTRIGIMRDGVEIAYIYSQTKDGFTPYPHDKRTYCLNSIQICGFDKLDGPWACGVLEGKTDVVLNFFPTDDAWYREKGEQYAKYVERFFKTKMNAYPVTEGMEQQIASVVRKDGIDIRKLRSFKDWLATEGAL